MIEHSPAGDGHDASKTGWSSRAQADDFEPTVEEPPTSQSRTTAASGEPVEQRLGVPQTDVSKPSVNEPYTSARSFISFRALALVAPQAGEAGRSAQPKRLRALAFRHSDRSMIILLRSSLVASPIHEIASKSMQLDLTGPLVGRLDELRSLDEAILPLLQECPTLV